MRLFIYTLGNVASIILVLMSGLWIYINLSRAKEYCMNVIFNPL